MGTEILRPQDILIERMRLNHHHNPSSVIPRRKSFQTGGYPKPNRKVVTRPEPKKRFSPPPPQHETAATKNGNGSLVMEQVTILKRGERKTNDNDSFVKKTSASTGDLVGCVTDRYGPEPEMVPRRIRVVEQKPERSEEVYAGSACFMSPSPRALPLPTFSKKVSLTTVDDSATKDLRRLLGLD